MLRSVCPKLPMRDKAATRDFYINKLGFEQYGGDYPEYLMVRKNDIEIHFFLFINLNPKDNYGQLYIRTDNIEDIFRQIHGRVETGPPQFKPWGQIEFSLLDPDNNLITFGQSA